MSFHPNELICEVRVKDRMGEEPNPETEQESEETTNVTINCSHSIHYCTILYCTVV